MLDVGLVASGHLPTAIEIEGSEVGWAIIDDGYVYRAVNEALARQNGVPAREHVGRTVDEILPRSAEVIRRLLDEARETGRPIVDEGVVWTDALGNERGAVVTYTPDFRCSDRGFVGWTALVRPIAAATAAEHARLLQYIRGLRVRAERLARSVGNPGAGQGGADPSDAGVNGGRDD